MKTILMIHREGNLNVNPNLSGIVETLCEQGYGVHYYCERAPGVPQAAPHPGARYVFVENGPFRLLDENYALVIGVDRQGIILASKVAKHLKLPLGLISYELFFAAEAGAAFKQPEIAACEGIAFAVCQGNERSRQLAIENRIPPERVIDIPVAGRYVRRGGRSPMLHKMFGLPPTTKIALYMGSIVSAWAMLPEVVRSSREWGADWALVLHGRYNDNDMLKLRRLYAGAERVYFTPQGALPWDQLQSLLWAADIGIALYRPTFADIHEGNNLRYLGLSSGKIATYLQHGLPVVVNGVGEMAEHVENSGLGIRLHGIDELAPRLRALDRVALENLREPCYRFFEAQLDLQARIAPLLQAIGRCMNSKRSTGASQQ